LVITSSFAWVTVPALLTFLLSSRYLALQSVITARLTAQLQLQEELFQKKPPYPSSVIKRRTKVYWHYSSGRTEGFKHVSLVQKATRGAYAALMLGCLHCIFRIASMWDVRTAIVAAVFMWADQLFIILSLCFLVYDLYGSINFFERERKFTVEMRNIIRKVLKKRDGKYESSDEPTIDSGSHIDQDPEDQSDSKKK